MAIVRGNTTSVNPTPGASSYTQSHNQNTGADGFLLVSIVMADTVNFNGCTYGGQTMTQAQVQTLSGMSQRVVTYTLLNPPTGSNNIVVSFTGNQWNPISIFAVSFTGVGGTGTAVAFAGGATPNSKTMTVSDGSAIYSRGVSSGGAFISIEIDGSSRTLEPNSHNTNKQTSGALSAIPLTAGSKNITHTITSANVSILAIEIQEAGGTGPGGSAQGSFLPFI